MLIRNMILEDIQEVVEIEKQCFSLPWSEQSFMDSITREDTIFLVCEENDKAEGKSRIVGYMGMYISFDEASVTNVAVLPEFRKKGYGQSLVSMAKEVARGRDVQTVFLEVRVSNATAISLYRKQGFEELGIRRNFYDHPKEDACIMKCELGV